MWAKTAFFSLERCSRDLKECNLLSLSGYLISHGITPIDNCLISLKYLISASIMRNSKLIEKFVNNYFQVLDILEILRRNHQRFWLKNRIYMVVHPPRFEKIIWSSEMRIIAKNLALKFFALLYSCPVGAGSKMLCLPQMTHRVAPGH